MEKTPIPNQKETANDRHPSFDVVEEPERPREEDFQKADDGDELPFDVPRD